MTWKGERYRHGASAKGVKTVSTPIDKEYIHVDGIRIGRYRCPECHRGLAILDDGYFCRLHGYTSEPIDASKNKSARQFAFEIRYDKNFYEQDIPSEISEIIKFEDEYYYTYRINGEPVVIGWAKTMKDAEMEIKKAQATKA